MNEKEQLKLELEDYKKYLHEIITESFWMNDDAEIQASYIEAYDYREKWSIELIMMVSAILKEEKEKIK